MEKKQLKDMSVIELKSVAYDLIAQNEFNSKQLQAINQRILELVNKPEVEKEITTEK